jgi:hypothetical protein
MTDFNNKPVLEPPAPTGRRRSNRRQVIVLVVLLVVAGLVFGGVWLATRHNASTAQVGDCVHQTGTDAVQVVTCTDPGADFKVVGRVEDRTEVDAGLSACDPYVDQGAVQFYWAGESGKTGYVLCLAKNG